MDAFHLDIFTDILSKKNPVLLRTLTPQKIKRGMLILTFNFFCFLVLSIAVNTSQLSSGGFYYTLIEHYNLNTFRVHISWSQLGCILSSNNMGEIDRDFKMLQTIKQI